MSNLSDKEIDRLSREASESYEPDGSYLSWSRLEQKLIEQMPERPPDGFHFGRSNPYLWGPAVVLIAGASFFFIKNSFYSPHSTQKIEPAHQISILPSGDSVGAENRAHYREQSSPNPKNASSRADQNFQPVESLSVSPSVFSPNNKVAEKIQSVGGSQQLDNPSAKTGANQTEANDIKSSQHQNAGMIIPATGIASGVSGSGKTATAGKADITGKTQNPNRTLASGAAAASDLASASLQNDAAKTAVGKSSARTSVYALPALASSGSGLGKINANDSLLNKQPDAATEAILHKSMHINRSLNIGFAFGADYTDAGGITNNQLSNNIGITLGYYLTSRLSVNTGLYYSNKFYWSPGHEHNRTNNTSPPPPPPPNYNSATWAYGPDIEYVNGACNMYELPLTLRYDFANNDRTKFFVNAGLSSYFMLKQTYIYFFHSGGRALAYKSNIESQSNYWFGMGDLSFGLESDLGKGFSFQAEPFFRIPLQKMGFENLKMYSYGFMLSFRYAPVLSRTKK